MKLIKACSYSFLIISLFTLLVLASTAWSGPVHAVCPFTAIYHYGDGFTDTGNSLHVPSETPNPAANLPYGITSPGYPTGRWSNGEIDFDFAASDFGLPHITPYLSWNASETYDGAVFSVARSTVLDISFFESRGIEIPAYAAVPLSVQMNWSKTYLESICSITTLIDNCAEKMNSSFFFFGDIEANDIGYALEQGKSIQEVETYVPLIIQTQLNYARELISMGATKLVFPGNAPLGCFPYILTALPSNNTTDYDELGCLKSVNDLIIWKNDLLQQALANLGSEFPDVIIYYGSIYEASFEVFRDASYGPNGELALQACCGTGGKYNYDSKRFCGSEGVSACPYPNQYIFWDGIHYTQQAYSRVETILIGQALVDLGCKIPFNTTGSQLSASALINNKILLISSK